MLELVVKLVCWGSLLALNYYACSHCNFEWAVYDNIEGDYYVRNDVKVVSDKVPIIIDINNLDEESKKIVEKNLEKMDYLLTEKQYFELIDIIKKLKKISNDKNYIKLVIITHLKEKLSLTNRECYKIMKVISNKLTVEQFKQYLNLIEEVKRKFIITNEQKDIEVNENINKILTQDTFDGNYHSGKDNIDNFELKLKKINNLLTKTQYSELIEFIDKMNVESDDVHYKRIMTIGFLKDYGLTNKETYIVLRRMTKGLTLGEYKNYLGIIKEWEEENMVNELLLDQKTETNTNTNENFITIDDYDSKYIKYVYDDGSVQYKKK